MRKINRTKQKRKRIYVAVEAAIHSKFLLFLVELLCSRVKLEGASTSRVKLEIPTRAKESGIARNLNLCIQAMRRQLSFHQCLKQFSQL